VLSHVDTVIVGGGQAGLALSRWLTMGGHDHVVLERGRIGERWRSERWDSLALLTPNWANCLPGQREHADPHGYLSGREFVASLERYARSFGAPVREGTTVLGVHPADDGGFRVRTDADEWASANVVLASGDCALPAVPAVAAGAPAGLHQLHASHYRAPQALPAGGVLVVGSGPSGHQIADELAQAGRRVVLATGRHARVPRRYRGRDIWAWMRDLGDLERTRDDLPYDPLERRTPTLPLDGRDGGRSLDLGILSGQGVRVAGRLHGFAGGHALFGDNLAADAARADERLQKLLARIDDHIASGAAGRDLPTAPAFVPTRLPAAPATIDLANAGITTIVWATGYHAHHPWLHVPAALDATGRVAHERGVTAVEGLFILGTRWQHRTISHQISGVGDDARFLAERIAGLPAAPRLAIAA
jgi:putative flavoprotein involved in K+ transport